MAPPSGVGAPKAPGNSLALTPPPEQPPSIQGSKSGAGEAQGSINKNRLAPVIIALNVALPLFSVLFLVITLSRMDQVARTTRLAKKDEQRAGAGALPIAS
jgi:hypothetical protein